MDTIRRADLRRELAAVYMCVTEMECAKRMKEFFTLHVSPIEEYFRGNHDDDDDDDDEEEVFNLLSKAGIKNIETMFPSLEEFLKRQELFARLSN